MNPREIKKLADELRIAPSKKRGQNFLITSAPMKKMIEAADLGPQDLVIEVGAGFGVLTEKLLETGARVITVEIEKLLAEFLQNKFSYFVNNGQLKIIWGDILRVGIGAILKFNKNLRYKVIANLPYHITGAIIPFFLESEFPPAKMLLMLQKEVGDKIISKPPRTNMLSISSQYFSKPSIVAKVPAGNFWPRPNVDSCIVLFDDIEARNPEHVKNFFSTVKLGFKHPRKQVLKAFPVHLRDDIASILFGAGLKETARPSELSVKTWEEIACL